MKYPSSNLSNSKFAMVKCGVIYEIGYFPNGNNDSCAVKMTSGNVRHFDVTNTATDEKTTYYLDCYLEDGDQYTSELPHFIKTIHKMKQNTNQHQQVSSGDIDVGGVDEQITAITSGVTPGFSTYGQQTLGAANNETTQELGAYFNELCVEAVKEAVMQNYLYTYEDFLENPKKLGIPLYMISSQGYTLEAGNSGVEQIEFTREFYNSIKEEGVRERCYKAAQDTAKKYGYEFTTDFEDITVEKKS